MKYLDILLKFVTGVFIYILLSITNLLLFNIFLYAAGGYLILSCIKYFLYDINDNESLNKIEIFKNILAFFGGLLIFVLQITSLEFTINTLILLLGFILMSFFIIMLQYENTNKKNYIFLILAAIGLLLSLVFNIGKNINLVVLFANSNLLVPAIIILIGLNILFKE